MRFFQNPTPLREREREREREKESINFISKPIRYHTTERGRDETFPKPHPLEREREREVDSLPISDLHLSTMNPSSFAVRCHCHLVVQPKVRVQSSKALFFFWVIMENSHSLIWISIFAFWVFVFVAMGHLVAP